MSDELVKVPAAPVGLTTRSVAVGLGVFTAIGVVLGGMLHSRLSGVIILGTGVAAFARNYLRSRRDLLEFNRGCAQALGRLHSGELADAKDFFWRWSERAKSPQVAATARLNLGWTLIWSGDLRTAVSVLSDVLERYEAELREQRLVYRTLVAGALAHALLGELGEAKEAIDVAISQRRDESPLLALYVASIIEIRQGTPEKAATALHEKWVTLEAGMTAKDLRQVRIVRALAIGASGVREAGSASAVIAGMRPTYPGEFAFLGAAWPEMHAFLASHELAG